jgi:hypothetical protein
MRPLAIDLFTGLHGWAEGLIAEGFEVIGFDIEDMSLLLGEPKPDHFHLVIQDVLTLHGAQFKDAALIVGSSPCQEFSYRAMPWKRAKALGPPELGMKLFHAQFRIQQQASEAKGEPIPMVVENVRGAQKWVGPARWNAGSMYLWGDVPALMPKDIKVTKVAGFRFDGAGGSFQTAATQQAEIQRAAKTGDPDRPRWFNDGPRSPGSLASSSSSSSSSARKAASAKIAKIPFALSSHIARVYKP